MQLQNIIFFRRKEMAIVLQLVLLVVGFVMLIKGADWFVDGASKIADKFGIPQLVIGLTIVAMGTSAPEAAVSITSALQGSAGITIGNVVGSNIMNVLVILGLTSVITAIPVQKSTVKYELPFLIGITAMLSAMGLIKGNPAQADGVITRIEGVVLWVFMLIYLFYLLQMAKKGEGSLEEVESSGKDDKMWKLLLLVVIGAAMIVLGSNVTVDAATELAKMFGMSERFIGLTIVAFGTSLPELVTSVTAAKKGKADIAVGNIVGSNVFNILFVVGTTALITPVAYSVNFLVDSIVSLAAVIFLWICVVKDKKLGRIGGAIMLLGYAGYFAYLMM